MKTMTAVKTKRRIVGKSNGTKDIIKKLDLSFGELPPDSPFVRSFNPEVLPWKLVDGSVEEAQCLYLLNRIPGHKRMAFMSELWRVLVPGGKCSIMVPYWSSPRSIQDPESVWPPLCENSFLYFTKSFRDANKLPDCGFDFEFSYGYTLDPETAAKSDEVRPFWFKHYIQSIHDLQVNLVKLPKN